MSSTYKIRLSGVVPPSTNTSKRSSKSIGGRRGGGGGATPSRHVVEISPSTTLTDLRTIALESFGVSSPLYRTELWIGFPPKQLVVSGDTANSNTNNTTNKNDGDDNDDGDFDNGNNLLVKDYIKAGENVLVKFEKLVVGSSPSPSSSKQSNTTKPMSNKSTTSRKAKSSLINGDKGTNRTLSKKRPRATTTTNNNSESNNNNESNININTNNQPSHTTTPKRPKRASAEAATASFPTAIRAQKQLLRAEQKQKQKRNTTNKRNTTTSTTNTKQKAAAEARAAAALSRRLASLPGGRCLNDETSIGSSDIHNSTTTGAASASVSPSSSSSARRSNRPRLKKPLFGSSITSESDVSVTLLSSLSSGNGNGGGGTVGKFLRTAMRNAVGRTYEVSRAVVRNTAVSGGTVTFLPHEQRLGGGGSSGSGSSTGEGEGEGRSGAFVGIHTVRYPKGIEGRGYYEEEVDVIGLDALKAVIQAVHADHSNDDEGLGDTGDGGGGGGGREMLRPQNMALLSPRVFWSLWFHFHHLPTSVTTGSSSETPPLPPPPQPPCTSIEEALVRLHPTLNWSFLTSRSRELSTKAKNNLRQKRERERGMAGIGTISDQKRREEEFKESQRAIEAVEDAMAKCYQEDVDSARERAGRAALARFESLGRNSGTDKKNEGKDDDDAHDDDKPVEWSLVTPDETDEDELRECISEGFKSMDEGSNSNNNNNNITDQNREAIDGWVYLIVSRGSIHNWRELANADSTALRSVLSHVTDPGVTKAKTTTTTTIDGPLEIPSIEAIDAWIDAAQSRTVEEIMLEILDGNEDLFCLLRDEGPRAGTPKDLCLWLSIPSMLLEEVRTALGKRKTSGGGDKGVGEEDELVVVESDVVRWCRRARTVVEKLQWLEDYITPI